MEPLDIMHSMLFPYGLPLDGEISGGEINLCKAPRYYSFPALEQILPQSDGIYVVKDFIDAVVCLLVCTVLLTVAMYLVHVIWNKIDEKFSSINPSHKKWYVIANLSKAFLLGIQALSFRYWWGVYITYFKVGRHVYRLELKRCTVLYIVTDVVALYMVPKLPRSTFLHHIATLLMGMVVWAVDITQPNWDGTLGIVVMIIIYGQCSTMAFLVNAYLAWRVVYPEAAWLKAVCFLALISYLLSCTVNWSLHLVWLYTCIVNLDISILTIIYLMGLGFVVNDDIKLIKWLIKQQSFTNTRAKKD